MWHVVWHPVISRQHARTKRFSRLTRTPGSDVDTSMAAAGPPRRTEAQQHIYELALEKFADYQNWRRVRHQKVRKDDHPSSASRRLPLTVIART